MFRTSAGDLDAVGHRVPSSRLRAAGLSTEILRRKVTERNGVHLCGSTRASKVVAVPQENQAVAGGQT